VPDQSQRQLMASRIWRQGRCNYTAKSAAGGRRMENGPDASVDLHSHSHANDAHAQNAHACQNEFFSNTTLHVWYDNYPICIQT
jgi:hypothetical protein